ncbi:MAG: hypothetical protein KME12_10930 [Trichocoleus desertorum ATA4-8-CV12]|nr:hypothetical protein [Trichocoleus desertorum ATA4-8-CV12]
MNITFFGRVSSLLSLSALLMVCGTLSAQAETVDVTATSDSNSADTYSFSTTSPVLFANHTESTSPLGTIQAETAPTEMAPATVADVSDVSTDMPAETAKLAPVPGTTATSAQVLTEQTATPSSPVEAIAPTTETEAPKVAQSIEPGRATRSGSSYIGAGLNVGITGDTALGDTNFTVLSKIGLTPTISVRPSVMIGDDADILIPVTLDFPSYTTDDVGISVAPYVGAGVAITTGDSDVVRLLLTGGVDVPLTPQFTATAAVNAAVLDDTDIGLLLGVGYNFTSR